MNTMLEKIKEAQSVEEMCTLFGRYLGLTEPIPLAILKRAIEEDLFAYRLITARNYPYMLEVLFNDPHNQKYGFREDNTEWQQQLLEDRRTKISQKAGFSVPRADESVDTTDTKTSTSATTSPAVPGHGNIELIGKATKALFAWGKTGFQRADEEVVKRRWAACQGCDFLTDPPKTMMYQGIKLLAGKGTKICSACGCVANKKVTLPTEKCPKQDPDNPNLSRWGEPWK